MPKTYVYTLHERGPALWPEHKPLAEVLTLKATTPEETFESTYQGNPSPPGGAIYQREWWRGQNRYSPSRVEEIARLSVGRWLSFDTAVETNETAAFTAAGCFDLMPDHRLLLRDVWRERLSFATLPQRIEDYAERWNYDDKLRSGESGILIESKSSGTSAYQTLAFASRNAWVRGLLIPWIPPVDKLQRARQASVWCRNGCILFPRPSVLTPWLTTFEAELFAVAAGAEYMDQADMFSQLIVYLEHVIGDAWQERQDELKEGQFQDALALWIPSEGGDNANRAAMGPE